MKRKDIQKAKDLKMIELAVLDKILGGIQAGEGKDTGAVIGQSSFGAFYHS